MNEQLSDDVFKLPQDWYEEGEDFFRRGLFDEARKAFEKALELDPYYPEALCSMSRLLWREGRYREAAECVQKALEIDSDDPNVIRRCAELFIAAGQKNDAVDVVRAYIERNPWDDEMRRFLEQIEEGSLQITPSEASSGLQSEREIAEADFLTLEGEKQFEKGRVDRARVCFEMALEHDPDHAKAHNNLGVILWNDGDLQGALEHFQKAFRAKPEDRNIVFNSFNALVEAGHLDVAKDLIKLHIQKDPFNEEAWELYDRVALSDQQIHWSPEGLSDSVADTYAEMAGKLLKKGDLYGAAEALHRALQINPDHVKATAMLARVHRDLNHEDEALGWYEKAMELDSENESLVIEYAEYLNSRHQVAKAREILGDFLEKKPSEKVQKFLEKISDGTG
ncbi:tetratricopeptide repeat protein [Thermodesulforhabdus norvegica]|uniref:Tfp pilus assembly protein PilF n=1 Tax=Thermodesulforhabdus norvegica TaxID=39841 RepID=A0A1I4SQQ0_9BACT|nr:tetratricopeptide repeat protein [Thermodesulforhabdus norvegica]SFM66643.1 Tfp pilus assembly protein PilF [Thermodesulforhabdus norvegica]